MHRLSYFIFISVLFFSCNQKDQVKPDIDDHLQRPYCNDPLAVNYNDSFPGKPDNNTCRYPDELFEGEWHLLDSIFKSDGSYLNFIDKIIQFNNVNDSLRNRIDISNWCEISDGNLHLVVDKYRFGYIKNTLVLPDTGQVICNNDTLWGSFQINLSLDTMAINLEEKNNSGAHLVHQGIAIKK